MTGPIEGIRVVDLSRIVVGPYCTMVLGDMGADVIKVELPEIGDETRKEINPRLIYCSITGFGPTGPFSHEAGIDAMVAAEAGLIGITGEKDRPPSMAMGR
ncbi:MAG: CoA transferase [Thermodesulfobacteriota bacterium]